MFVAFSPVVFLGRSGYGSLCTFVSRVSPRVPISLRHLSGLTDFFTSHLLSSSTSSISSTTSSITHKPLCAVKFTYQCTIKGDEQWKQNKKQNCNIQGAQWWGGQVNSHCHHSHHGAVRCRLY